jgi:hypothetical protein
MTTSEKLRSVSTLKTLKTAIVNILSQLDWLGYIITMFAVVLFSMGLSWSNNPCMSPTKSFRSAYDPSRYPDPWIDAHVLAPFILGLAAFAILALYSAKLKRTSYIPHELFL